MAENYFDASQEDIRAIPLDKTIRVGGIGGSRIPAINAGQVDLRVWINRKCPFVRTPWYDDVFVFNGSTIRALPDYVKASLDWTPGTEGVFLKPRVAYRHTFLAGGRVTESSSANGDPSADADLDELPIPTDAFSNGEPPYKLAQTFLLTPTVFSDKLLTPSEYRTRGLEVNQATADCSSLPIFSYDRVNRESISIDTPEPDILMPMQTSASHCSGIGVHYRVQKALMLFGGQDFFVEFHKRAISSDIPRAAKPENSDYNGSGDSFTNTGAMFERYRCLDPFNSTRRPLAGLGQLVPINWGVVNYDGNFNASDEARKAYDLRDQAYYIVETGFGDPEHNYVFIICQRGRVRCVRLDGSHSLLMGEFNGRIIDRNLNRASNSPTGKTLVEADWFRMTVRNHLTNFVVTFEGPGFESEPWIIRRADFNATTNGNEPPISFVPMKTLGTLTIWSGNIVGGFHFGPLQYGQNDDGAVEFSLPAQSQAVPTPSTGVNSGQCGSSADLENIDENSFLFNSYSLPAGGIHSILFSAYDHDMIDRAGSSRNGGNNDDSSSGTGNGSFYTLDAQEFDEYVRGSQRITPGSYQYGSVLRDVQTGSRPSRVSVCKIERANAPSDRAEVFRTKISLIAGSHRFAGANGSAWELKACKTPVLTLMRFKSEPTGDPRWDESGGFEASEHVMEFGDSWIAQDFTKIDHNGRIKFLLNRGATYDNNRTNRLLALRKKAFYIEVWAGYVPHGTTFFGSEPCNYSQIPGFYKMFTGVCYGGTVTVENGQRVMECQIFDYSKVLQDQLIFNSPFFDGVRDFNAVDELMKMGGFRSSNQTDPGYLVRQFANIEGGQDFVYGFGPDGRPVVARQFILPQSYARLTQPFFRFRNASRIYDAIIELAKRSGKVFFFDTHGVAHYESYFEASVLPTIGGEGGVGSGDIALFYFTSNPSLYEGQIVFNSVSYNRAVADAFNHVKVWSKTVNNENIWLDDFYWQSVENPDAEGFIGYFKTLYQQEPLWGNYAAVKGIMDFYRAMRNPPLVVRFETYGQPIRALDVVALDGQPLRVMRIDTEINPQKNLWWQTMECEWMLPPNESEDGGGLNPAP